MAAGLGHNEGEPPNGSPPIPGVLEAGATASQKSPVSCSPRSLCPNPYAMTGNYPDPPTQTVRSGRAWNGSRATSAKPSAAGVVRVLGWLAFTYPTLRIQTARRRVDLGRIQGD